VAKATLAIVAEPHTVEVFVNGVRRGRGVVTIGVEPEKAHKVEFRLQGAPTASREVTVAAGATKTVRATFPHSTSPQFAKNNKNAAAARTGTATTATASRAGTTGTATTAGTTSSAATAGTTSRATRTTSAAAAAAAFRAAAEDATRVRLVMRLMDGQGRSIAGSRAKVSFGGVVLAALPGSVASHGGAWPLPVGKPGTLEVSVPGFIPVTHPLHFPAAGPRYISFVLQPVPVPVSREWQTVVEDSSKDAALVLLRDTPGQTPSPGQALVLEPARAATAAAAADAPDPAHDRAARATPAATPTATLRLSVLEVRGGSVICQILPGQAALSLPPPGAAVTVRLGGVSSPAKP
jgi:hypothetical protein